MKKFTKLFALVLAMVMTVSLITGVDAQAAKKVTVKSVKAVDKLTGKKTITLAKGKKATIKATVTATPNKAANKKVTYKTSNKKVATVTKKGVITAKKAGSAKITVTSTKNKKKTAKITVKVVAGKVTSVALDKKEASIVEGEKAALKATVKTSGKKPNKTLVWTSSDNTVATVDAKGNVTAVKAGKATITATATDGTKKKATCAVTVTAKAQPEVKYNTAITVDTKKEATVTVTFTNKDNAENDIQNLVKALGLTGEKTVTVDGVAKQVVVKNGTLVSATSGKNLSEVANGKTVKIKLGDKALTAIKVVAFASTSDVIVEIDGLKVSKINVKADGSGTANINGKDMTIVSIDTKTNVITVADDVTTDVKAAGAVTKVEKVEVMVK